MQHKIETILSFIGSKEKLVHCKMFLFFLSLNVHKDIRPKKKH